MSASDSALGNALLHRAWTQWIALGVDAVGERDVAVVDPEALIALTAELGDADARLRDASTDWCVSYGRYINGARLKQVVRELGTPLDAIGTYVATVAAAGGPKWPMATAPRSRYEWRSKARLESALARPQIRIRLRAAFGVNARADVLAALLAEPEIGLSVADLARRTRFTKPNVAFAVDALVVAGLLEARVVGNERRIALIESGEILPGLRPPIAQPDWVGRFGVALEVLRFAGEDTGSSSVRAIEQRRLAESLMARIQAAGLPRPKLVAFGDEFVGAFQRWVIELGFDLRSPSSVSQETQ
jgi:DNA-binding transcriptional ArsR family regulator